MSALNSAVDAIALRTGYRAWPLSRHVFVALLALVAIALLVWGALAQQRTRLQQQRADLAQMQQALNTPPSPPSAPSEPDFTQRWPSRDGINAVVKFLGLLATQQQINLGQMTLSHTASSEQAVGRVDISLTMNGSYAAGKSVLAELLSRYPSLAVQSLAGTPRSGDTSRIDWVLAMTLYVKD